MTNEEATRLKALARERWVKGEITKHEYDNLVGEISAEYRAANPQPQKPRMGIRGDDGPSEPTIVRPVAPAQLQLGMTIGKYKLLSRVRGGMGVVFKAEDVKGERLVALKFLPPELLGNADEIARIKATFKLVEQLDHSSICRVFDLDEHPAFGWYQVMRWIEGQTLSAYRRDEYDQICCLSVTEVAQLLLPVAEALDYAHGRKVLHRDIKPQNIMRAADGSISVVDFGLAAEVRSSLTRVSKGAVDLAGTQPFLAPELWEGGYASPKSDQYALGITAYELLAGRYPFNADNSLILMQAVLNKPIPVIEDIAAEAMSALQRCLARQAAERFGNCREFAAALREVAPNEWQGASRRSEESASPAPIRPSGPLRPKPEDDLAVIFGQMQAKAEKIKTAAEASLAEHDYAQAVSLLGQIPEGLRGEVAEMLRDAMTKRDRVHALNQTIREATPQMKLDVLRPAVDEILQLQPQREDMQRLNAKISKLMFNREPLERVLPAASTPKPVASLRTEPVSDVLASDVTGRYQSWGQDPVAALHTPQRVAVKPGNKAGERMSFKLAGIEYACRWCPPGKFTRGAESRTGKGWLGKLFDSSSSDDEPQEVELTCGFWLQETQVTHGMWQAVMGTTPWQGQNYVTTGGRMAATYINWNDAQEFCQKLQVSVQQANALPMTGKIMLPSEARWEYACRAGTNTAYSFGNDAKQLSDYAWFDGNAWSKGEQYAHEVGLMRANRWGLFDMHGNVWEWCEDYYQTTLPGGRDPLVTAGWSRVLRGGSWRDVPRLLRCSYRNFFYPTDRGSGIGFRVVVES